MIAISLMVAGTGGSLISTYVVVCGSVQARAWPSNVQITRSFEFMGRIAWCGDLNATLLGARNTVLGSGIRVIVAVICSAWVIWIDGTIGIISLLDRVSPMQEGAVHAWHLGHPWEGGDQLNGNKQ